MSKTCAFLGNDYDTILGRRCGHNTPSGLKERIRAEIIKLIKDEDVTEFLVGELGGYEIDAYDTVLEVQKEYPSIRIILVISKITDLHEVGAPKDTYIPERRSFDDFIFPSKCELGYKKLGIVYRNRYIIENTNFIIAYNQYHGKAYEFCKQAKNKGVNVIELGEEIR